MAKTKLAIQLHAARIEREAIAKYLEALAAAIQHDRDSEALLHATARKLGVPPVEMHAIVTRIGAISLTRAAVGVRACEHAHYRAERIGMTPEALDRIAAAIDARGKS